MFIFFSGLSLSLLSAANEIGGLHSCHNFFEVFIFYIVNVKGKLGKNQ